MPNNNIDTLDKAVNLRHLKLVYEELLEGGSSDVHVTAPEYHYAPQTDASAQLTAAREGAAGTYALGTEYEVLTGLKVQRDAKGHITGVTYTSQKVKDTNTTYSAGTAALLTAGTNTANRTWQAKILADYVNGQVDEAALYPVDISTLTPSSTFRKNAVIGINGILYRATAATSNMPCTMVTNEAGTAFVVNIVNGKTAFVVTDPSPNSGWEIWTDASIEYWIAQINESLSGKQAVISDLSTIRSNASAGAAIAPMVPSQASASNQLADKNYVGNPIVGISRSGTTFTATHRDGTTSTFTQQDNNTTYTPAALGFGYGTCATAAATAAKVVTLSNYALVTGGYVTVKFTYAVPANATLNVNSKGAKAIYYKGAAITASVIQAGDTATFVYDGSRYHLIAIDTAIDILNTLRTKTVVVQ